MTDGLPDQQTRSRTGPQSIVQRIREWPRSRQLSLLAVVLLSLAVFTYLILQARVADYQLLYAELTQKEASSVVTWLQDNNIPYELRNKGQAVYVPADMVYKTRLDLAGAGLPKGQGVGFEIFDKQRFGVTKFTQEVNYQRALQGELARSVASLDVVKNARVHLVLPEKRVLQEMQEKPKASAMVEMEGGQVLSQNQIDGILHLIAGSVEGLEPEQVTVVTAQGRMLSDKTRQDMDSTLSPRKLEYKQQVESSLQKRASSLLDQVFGPGNAMVEVTANIDFVKKNTTEEVYDPESLVPRSEKSTEKVQGRQVSGGIPGSQSNLQMANATAGSIPSQESSEIINYEISRTVNRITKGMGDIRNISVAVLLSEQFVTSDANQDGRQETLDSVQRLVSGALGLNSERGDRIEVVSMPLKAKAMQGGTAADSGPWLYDYLPLIKYILLFMGFALAYFFLVRPLIKVMRGEETQPYRTVQELESEYELEAGSRPQDPIEQLKQEIANSEVKPSQIVRIWLREK